MSCCPPNAEKFLAPDYSFVGTCQSLTETTEAYTSGTAAEKKALILIPDIWGWNGGRTRNIADWFAEQGYLAVVPKFLVPNHQGGTDGDGLPPDFDIMANFPTFAEYISQITWEDVLKKRFEDTVAWLKGQGVTRIFMLGHCWGGWALIQALDGPFADNFVCGAVAHPSMHLENMLFKRDALAQFEKCRKPLLLLPTKGDPDSYYEEGAWFQALKANHPTSETVKFLEVNHGFLPRGDINDPVVKEQVDRALPLIANYFKKHNDGFATRPSTASQRPPSAK